MDKSAEYIKMCEKAVEIQKMRKLGFPFNLVYSYERRAVVRQCALKEDEFLIWLPEQDQLQEMCNTINGVKCKVNLFVLVNCLLRFMKKDHHCLQYADSMEQVWLCYTMKLKFNKQWNGEDWVKYQEVGDDTER